MIKQMNIKNFKSLLDANLELGNFNLFCGTNSSGKTSIIHSLLFLTQNANAKNVSHLNGKMVQLGQFVDVKNFASSITEEICIEGVLDSKTFSLAVEEDENYERLASIKKSENLSYFEYEKNIYYISANRIGIREVHDSGNDSEHYGINGEFAVDYLIRNKDRVVPEEYVFDIKRDLSPNLLNEVDYWLYKITGAHIKANEVENTNKSVVTFSHKNGERYVRSINTGSGISYALSIIILCMGVASTIHQNEITPTIIIENPEIHLHPKAQSLLTEFLIFMSSKIQLIIETQSDHVFNRFRIEVYNRKIESDKITGELGTVHFLQYINNQSIVNKIEFSRDGRVKNSQMDLFDQFDIDVLKLLGVKDDGELST